jgi:hypothetical protein
LKKGSLPYIVLGNTFSYSDLLMYSIGGVLGAWLDLHVLQKRGGRHGHDDLREDTTVDTRSG